jgi:hypothetical protein
MAKRATEIAPLGKYDTRHTPRKIQERQLAKTRDLHISTPKKHSFGKFIPHFLYYITKTKKSKEKNEKFFKKLLTNRFCCDIIPNVPRMRVTLVWLNGRAADL